MQKNQLRFDVRRVNHKMIDSGRREREREGERGRERERPHNARSQQLGPATAAPARAVEATVPGRIGGSPAGGGTGPQDASAGPASGDTGPGDAPAGPVVCPGMRAGC